MRRPRLPVRVLNPDDRTRYLDMDMLIDSGADTTCLPLAVALAIGVDLTTMIPIATEGVGGSQQAQLCPTGALLVCGVLIDPCPILFLQGQPELLLGRERVFDVLSFGFEQSAWSAHVRVPTPSVRS